jgi:hypothetical protein
MAGILLPPFILTMLATQNPDVRYQEIGAKMKEEADRLKAEFSRCFENLSPADFENLTENEIQLILAEMMPEPDSELSDENIQVIVLNAVMVQALENDLRVFSAEMQYVVSCPEYPELEISNRLRNENVLALDKVFFHV